jgi:hypothetical protein
MKYIIKYWKKIPERYYFPIFVFASLFFVLNELIVLSLIVLYVVGEKYVRNSISKISEDYEGLLWWIGIIFFLVMIDDTLLYLSIMVFIIWDTRKRNLQKRIQKRQKCS